MSLRKYLSKRDLKKSGEPFAKKALHKKGELKFVVQKHAARRLHYDFRIEVEGVLKSWAVPKGPSLNPADKRLAIEVEDHPYDYKDFEGIIPAGYGTGTVIIWDQGTYSVEEKTAKESEKLIKQGLKKGEIHFTLNGEKLKGEFALVRLKKSEDKPQWLLIKKKDAFTSKKDITKEERSVVSNATIEELSGKKKPVSSLKKVPKSRKPHHVQPMLSTLIDQPFDHEDWIFEIKWDGFRAIAEVNGNQVELYSRNFQSFNTRFAPIVEQLKQLKIDAIFDGEIVIVDSKGKSSFQLLQNAGEGIKKGHALQYYIFDLLYLNGHDLRALPLIERKQLLKEILSSSDLPIIKYSDHIEKEGKAFFKASIRNNLEGIIGKLKTSAYISGRRTKQWVKIKNTQRQEAIICGFTEPKKGRKNIGALILGVYKKDTLHFIGHVGGGFTETELREVKKLLTPFIQKTPPFKTIPKTNTPVTWVKPHFLCEVAFSEWTADGSLRHPIFLGIRDDKSPKAVVQEKSQEAKSIVNKTASTKKGVNSHSFLTHLDKVYWPKEGITKGDVIAYYESIADTLLPYLKDRPESLKRFPNGIEGESFFQKNLEHHPEWISTVEIQHKEKLVNYLLIQDLDSLLYAVNLGCIEIHPFFSRYKTIDKPDFLVFDLDPEAISFDKVIETAQVLHAVLDEIGVPSYCKTSGSRGLHICVPLKARYTYEQAKQFALLVGMVVHKQIPNITSLERSPKNRQKRVYIDCLQNNPGQTLAFAYSLRAKPLAPVSTPLKWTEVKKGLNPSDYTIHTLPKRLKKVGDLFQPILTQGASIEKALKKIEKLGKLTH